MSGRWVVILTPAARRDVRRLDSQIKRRVEATLDRLANDPESGRLRKLVGRPESRLRVGDWRVFVELDRPARAIVVHHILPRGRAYDR
ncbi:MAG: type II toxin-antitoxin system RelE family toxin [Solirubrobacteraceae bacterium]